MLREFFVDVKGYEGLYRCSNEGRIFHIKKSRFLTQTKQAVGYYKVWLFKGVDKANFGNYIHNTPTVNFSFKTTLTQ